MKMKYFIFLAVTWICAIASAAPLSDLSGGQIGRIEFESTTPADPWAMVHKIAARTQPVVIWGDLSIPENAPDNARVVVLGHGSEGVGGMALNIYVKALNQAGIATFVVDSYNPRGFSKHTAETRPHQNATANISDALHALKLLATHPRIDPENIYFVGQSTGGRTALYGAFPAYIRAVVPPPIKWAGSVGLYPSGCTNRYRIDHHGTNPSRLHLILAEKDEMTPAKPCIEFADQLKAAGHNVSYVVYPDTYHGFDHPDRKWMKVKDGATRDCNFEIVIPTGGRGFGKGYDHVQNKPITTPAELTETIKSCSSPGWVTLEINPKARDRAVKEVVDFIRSGPYPGQ